MVVDNLHEGSIQSRGQYVKDQVGGSLALSEPVTGRVDARWWLVGSVAKVPLWSKVVAIHAQEDVDEK